MKIILKSDFTNVTPSFVFEFYQKVKIIKSCTWFINNRNKNKQRMHYSILQNISPLTELPSVPTCIKQSYLYLLSFRNTSAYQYIKITLYLFPSTSSATWHNAFPRDVANDTVENLWHVAQTSTHQLTKNYLTRFTLIYVA